MTAVRHQTHPRVPVVLPVVRVTVDSDGLLQVAIDHEPYDVPEVPARRSRDALRSIVDDITRRLGPVRVEVTESDGAVFTDIATPPDPSPCETGPARPSNLGPGELTGTGFLPEEEVAVAVIVAHQPARADGTARLRLPPTVLAGQQGRVVLLGRVSGTVAWGAGVGGGVGGGV
jgi:hypothetical protein